MLVSSLLLCEKLRTRAHRLMLLEMKSSVGFVIVVRTSPVEVVVPLAPHVCEDGCGNHNDG